MEALSPVARRARTDKQHRMIERHFSTVSFAALYADEGEDGEEPELNHLPESRTRENPNARGGSIKVEPKAPTIRLDGTL
jgi:hypothetical protein